MTHEQARELVKPGQVIVFLFPSREEVECVDMLDAVNERAQIMETQADDRWEEPGGMRGWDVFCPNG